MYKLEVEEFAFVFKKSKPYLQENVIIKTFWFKSWTQRLEPRMDEGFIAKNNQRQCSSF